MKIWYDLTDLSQWRGHHTGIQRVVYQLARQFDTNDSAVGYFIFNSRDNQFYETSIEPIIERVEAAVVVHNDEQTAEVVSGLGRIKNGLRTIAYKLPQPVRSRLPYAFIGRSVYVAHLTVNTIRKHRAATAPRPSILSAGHPVTFQKGDRVLVFGSEWDNVGFMPTMIKARADYGFKLYQIVYDLIPAIMPQLFGEALLPRFTRYMFEVGASSDGLLAISHSSARDMKDFCKSVAVTPPPIATIRLGDDFVKQTDLQPPVVNVEPGRFILSVGTIEIRKNHALLYQVYHLAREAGIELPPMVIVGKLGWLSGDVLNAIEHDPLTKGKIITISNASDSELGWLYENCLFTVYPSLYEGWGLPIAEALAYGKMCLAANTSSMTEIAGDLIEYHSPYDPRQLLDLMIKYLDPKILAQREAAIATDYKTSNWLEAYQQVRLLIDR